MKDILIPIVFPEYRIAVTIPRTNVDILPWVEFDNFSIRASNEKFSNLGHAGLLLVNGKSGLTKYYEYGRYDKQNLGLVRRVPVPDAKLKGGLIDMNSLKAPLHQVSNIAGQKGRIEGVLLEADSVFDKVIMQIKAKKSLNNNPSRPPYNLTSNSCIHFVKWAVRLAGKDTPWMIDPRPNSYIGEFREDYRDLDYYPIDRRLKIEDVGEF